MFTNAVLLAITGPGTPDEYGNTSTGTNLWTGRAAGYLKRERRTVVSGGQQVNVRRDVFTILNTAGASVAGIAGPDWEATTVLIDDLRASSPVRRRFTVIEMEHRAAGTPLDSVRLELDTETVAA